VFQRRAGVDQLTRLVFQLPNPGLAWWPTWRLPNSRQALAAAEWARRRQPRAFPQLHKELFAAHFVLGEPLDDSGRIREHSNMETQMRQAYSNARKILHQFGATLDSNEPPREAYL